MLSHARLTIGRKLALSFAAVVAIFVAALLLAAHFDGSAQNQWRTLLRWDRGYAAIQQEVEGTRTQMAAQALYAATFDPKYKAEWEHGVAISDAGAKAAEVIADPTITRIARSSQAADPMALVATIGHELGHERLAGEGRVAGRADEEQLTDLLTVYFGLGVFNANAAFQYTSAGGG